jgi:hypothetical protein
VAAGDDRAGVGRRQRGDGDRPSGADVPGAPSADRAHRQRTKKLAGFYRDEDREHYSAYRVDTNEIINDDRSGHDP